MKKMKTINLVLLLISFSGFSQIKYGVKGGFNFADVNQGLSFSTQYFNTDVVYTSGTGQSSSQTSTEAVSQTIEISTTSKISFYLGVYAEYPINKKRNLNNAVFP
jgi:hypothetical protein